MMKNDQKRRKGTDAVKILDKMIGENRNLQRSAHQAVVNAEVAQMIYQVRTQARLTQKGLAELVGTTQSVIARLESADYEGHSLPMLHRIASAVNKRLELRFVPNHRKAVA